MEWTIRWWKISVQRVYPTNAQLSQTYNQAAFWWHQHLRLLGYSHAYRELWRTLKNADILLPGKNKLTICDCGIGTAAFSLAFAQTINPKAHIWHLLTFILVGLFMGLEFAHTLELLTKMQYDGALYVTIQNSLYLRTGVIPWLFFLHSFQTSTPCLSIARYSSFAITS
ncbi:hypothetical protein [Nostoc sp. DedQUE04]|uniref:hypothetical protein n=1 Tax=Nostoc sp. DedQUE04 TaxID=3075390 RepID=UPI002AD3AE4E|nr:hypothetical protein [Nostoc sp. DedQUE04]